MSKIPLWENGDFYFTIKIMYTEGNCSRESFGGRGNWECEGDSGVRGKE